MKSYFTKFGAFLLCGVMLAAVGCHDYDEDIQQVNNKVDNLDKNYAAEVEDLEKAIAELDAKYATDTELASKLTELQNTVNTTISSKVEEIQAALAGKADASALSEAIKDLEDLEKAYVEADKALEAALKSANAEADKVLKAALEEAYAKADKELEKALKALIDNKADNSTVKALEGLVETNKNDVAALKDRVAALEGVDAKIEAALVDLKSDVAALKTGLKEAKDLAEQNAEDIENLIAVLENEIIPALQDGIDGNKKAIEALQNAGYITLSDVEKAGYITGSALDAKLVELKDAYGKADNELKAELNGEISTLEGKITTVEGQIKTINEKLATLSNYATVEALNTAIGNLRTELTDYVDAAIAELSGKIESVKVDVNNLINSIQSIVYKPEYADGKARIAYASVAGYKLDGDTKLTYKVYPKEYADSIAAAFNHPENPKSFISYDMTPVTKAAVPSYSLDVVGVAAAEGELTVTVRAVGLNALYDGSQSYSAALVLENGIDHYSTEYTNLTVNPAASEYKLVLYKDGKEFDPATVLSNEVVFNNKVWTKNLFEGLTPMFKPAEGPALNEADFAVKYTLKDADGNDLKVSVANEHNAGDLFQVENTDRVLNATLKESYHVDNVGKGFDATSTYKFGTDAVVAKANVKLIKFPYTLMVKATEASASVGYNQIDKVFKPLTDYSVYFLDVDSKEVSVEEVEKTYCLKGEDFVNVTGKPDLFDISKEIPVTVALKSENGVGKATAENVGDCVYLYYKHFDSIINQSAVTQEAKIAISKIQYSFEFPGVNAFWTYLEDAEEDKLGAPSCTRSYEYEVSDASIKSENKPADQTIATVFNDNASLAKVTVNGVDYIKGDNLGDCPVEFVYVDADNVKINFNALAWNEQTEDNKTYDVVAVYDRTSAEVTVKASITIKDRVRGDIELTIGEGKTMPYEADLINESIETPSLEGVYAKLAEEGYLGVIPEGADYMAAVLAGATANEYAVNDFTGASALTTGIKFADDFQSAVVGFNYKNLYKNLGIVGAMPKVYNYAATFTTWYGQKVTVKNTLTFTDPDYNFERTQFVTRHATENCYYSVVTPLYKAGGIVIEENFAAAAIDAFATDKVVMANAFKVTTPAGVSLEASELAANKLATEFKLEGQYEGITLENNILNYGGKAEYVDVTGAIKMINADGQTFYAIDNTIFTTEDAYKNYRVYGYDPLGALTAPAESVKWDLSGKTGTFTKNVLHYFSIKDVRGFSLINNDEEDANEWIVGNDANGFVTSASVLDVYGIEPTYEIKLAEGQSVAGIVCDSTTGVITADVNANLGILEDVKIEVTLSINYPYAETKSATFEIVIPATAQKK